MSAYVNIVTSVSQSTPFLYTMANRLVAMVDPMLDYPIEKWRFQSKVGYRPNIHAPDTFGEKILWKKLNDRNPLLPMTADKYKAREYIRHVLGKELSEDVMIPLLHVSSVAQEIPFDDLPPEYIIKTNHASKRNIIVADDDVNNVDLIRCLDKWLRMPYGISHEWAYNNIQRKIIIEKLLRDSKGNIPSDYKFFVFHGQCRLILLIRNRLGRDVNKAFFDTDWNHICTSPKSTARSIETRPHNLQDAIEIANELGKCFDFVRVDMYLVNDKIYFGEMTHYPTSGRKRLPRSLDLELGRIWHIRPEYWKNDMRIRAVLASLQNSPQPNPAEPEPKGDSC